MMPGLVWSCVTPQEDGRLGTKLQDTCKLPLDAPQPTWSADPTHQTKVVMLRFFSLLKQGKGHHQIPRLTTCI
eukprot:13739335-Ditylum_brightwellii.AAC.1